jgi:hypothetical protein
VVVPSLPIVFFSRSFLDVKLLKTTLLFAPPPPLLLLSAMSYYAWITRCIPAFSICAVAILLVLALIVQPHGREEEGK